jgi:hypothetical protein
MSQWRRGRVSTIYEWHGKAKVTGLVLMRHFGVSKNGRVLGFIVAATQHRPTKK